MKFRNRVVVVAGSSGEVAREVALAFAHNGARVVFSGPDEAAVRVVAAEIESAGGESAGVAADVSRRSDVDRLIGTAMGSYGRIDILVNNAGAVCGSSDLEHVTDEEWDQIIDRSMKSVFLCSRAVIGIMKKQNRGRIINVVLQAGKGAPALAGAHNVGAKAGIIGFTCRLAKELYRFDLRVRAIALSLVYGGTPSGPLWGLYYEEELDKFIGDLPVGRLVTSRDAAAAVVSLASGRVGRFEGALGTYGFGWGI